MSKEEIVEIFVKYLKHQEGKTEYLEVSKENFISAIAETIKILQSLDWFSLFFVGYQVGD